MKQPDLVCTECPLEKCDEESLWCMFRLLTSPNTKQKAFVKQRYRRNQQAYLAAYYKEHREERLEYFRNYYQRRRKEKLAAANARNARLREIAGNSISCEKVSTFPQDVN